MDFILLAFLFKLLAWSNPISGKLGMFFIFAYIFYLFMKRNKFNFSFYEEYKNIFIIIIIALLLFVIMVFNSFVIKNTTIFTTVNIYLYVYFFTFLVILAIFFDRRKFAKIINNIIIFFLLSILIAILLDLVFLYDYYVAHYSLGFINYVKNRVDTVYYYRGCGFFSDPTAHITIIFLLPLILFTSYKFNLIKTKLFVLGNIIGLISSFLSTSKIGIPLYLLEIFGLYITMKISFDSILLKLIKFITLLVIIFAIVAYLVYYLDTYYGTPIMSTLEHFGESSGTVTERFLTYRVGLQIIDNHILFGIGFNQINKYLPLTIHNTFLQIWAENGIFGLLYVINIFILLPIVVILSIKKSYLKYSFFCFYIVFFIKINVVDALHTLVPFIYFYAIFFILYMDYTLRKKKKIKGFNINDYDRL